MLDRLVRRGYVRRTEVDRYALTLKLFELAHGTPPLQRLIAEAMPLMRQFSFETEQACHMVTYDKRRLVVVAQVDAPGYWSVAIRVGSGIDLLDTGSGHVFLAYASEADRRLMLQEDDGTSKEISPALTRHLAEVKKNGHERMRSLQIPAVINLAVPVMGPMGTVVATLACPFVERLDRHNLGDTQYAAEQLSITAAKIFSGSSETLG